MWLDSYTKRDNLTMNDGNQKMFLMAIMFVLALFLLTSCGEPQGDVNNLTVTQLVTDIETVIDITEQTITVANDMITNTVIDGNGAFSCDAGCN